MRLLIFVSSVIFAFNTFAESATIVTEQFPDTIKPFISVHGGKKADGTSDYANANLKPNSAVVLKYNFKPLQIRISWDRVEHAWCDYPGRDFYNNNDDITLQITYDSYYNTFSCNASARKK
jgi:hypothetical protein